MIIAILQVRRLTLPIDSSLWWYTDEGKRKVIAETEEIDKSHVTQSALCIATRNMGSKNMVPGQAQVMGPK